MDEIRTIFSGANNRRRCTFCDTHAGLFSVFWLDIRCEWHRRVQETLILTLTNIVSSGKGYLSSAAQMYLCSILQQVVNNTS